ncbi:hypothetical protein GCM10023143_26190 [Compostibacter hankyongensis]|uniref:Carboxypeptidase-like regulatory domain-containing protein n=1 Tax=Compostibacter hankyongensis TaxID=1007089 RepID=A0ABP8G0Z7_9BACT
MHGRVEDSATHSPVPGARIANLATYTVVLADDSGGFSIPAIPGDRLRVSALGFEEKELAAGGRRQLTVTLPRKVNQLPEIAVVAHTYRSDSAKLRSEYDKFFHYHKPRAGEIIAVAPLGVGINIDKLYEWSHFRANKRKLRFRQELLNYEQERYIDHVFNPEVVKKIIPLIPDDSLILFLKRYRPSYPFLKNATQYDLYAYIKNSYRMFSRAAAADTALPALRPVAADGP